MTKIKNIIFDFDGTLADTSALIVATMQKTARDLGLPYRSENEIKATIGVRLEEIPLILWPTIKDIGELFAKTYKNNFEILKDKIPITLFPGVEETLSFLISKGLNLAVATSRSHKSVAELTEQLRIKSYFDYLLGGDDVTKGKPHPESIFKIMDEMEWNPEETMMSGDMSMDILMGKNAGLLTCGVVYGNGTRDDLERAGADFIMESFNELTSICGI